MTHTQALIDTITILNRREKALKEICDLVISASLYWSSKDEEKNPALRTLRTLAGEYRANIEEGI